MDDAQALLTSLEGVSPPGAVAILHGDAIAYFRRFVDWLTLEQEYSRTLVDACCVEANEMIPEIEVQRNMLDRDIGTAQFTYQL